MPRAVSKGNPSVGGVALRATWQRSGRQEAWTLKPHAVTAGCGTLKSNFTKGVPDTRGALFTLNLAFTPAAGQLRRINESQIGDAWSRPAQCIMLPPDFFPEAPATVKLQW